MHELESMIEGKLIEQLVYCSTAIDYGSIAGFFGPLDFFKTQWELRLHTVYRCL